MSGGKGWQRGIANYNLGIYDYVPSADVIAWYEFDGDWNLWRGNSNSIWDK